ncbi:hypothetical protein ACHAWO_009489 [Cyclotella atomus]|uniref:Uncharacterized protein n=1 Tax=Cyclotella atomus TaxID=382360 RepID=A0ABD3N0P2_9STRA
MTEDAISNLTHHTSSKDPATSQPSRSPLTNSPSSSAPTNHPTFRSPTQKPSSRPTAKPSNGDTRWYPGTSKCLSDGKAPSWQSNLYASQTTCCINHFNWDYNNCLGIKQQPTYKWYANWIMNRCVQDCDSSEGGSCGGIVGGSYVITHNSAEACCSAHMSYMSISQCKY